MKSNLAKKQLTMVTLVLALALAVYLNWRLAQNDNRLTATGIVSGGQVTTETGNTSAEETENSDRYYGEALFVSTEGQQTNYFSEARLNRTTSRDAALDTLQKSLQKANLTQAEKEEIVQSMAAVAGNINVESNIESLVKAKGFADCVVYINADKIKVVVSAGSEGLTVSQVSQIKEIVIEQCNIPVQNITIVEIK